MQESTVRKVRFFGAWEDDREEVWLREMAAKGFHLKELPFPCVYTFQCGAPRDDSYRLDFATHRGPADYQDYLQIFRDAGWEPIGRMGNWQYFRKPAIAGSAPEIYTDAESRIGKYRRLLGFLVVFLPIMIVMATRTWDGPYPFLGPLSAILLAFALLYAYAMVQILRRIRRLQKKL
jgi:hypothetical protein